MPNHLTSSKRRRLLASGIAGSFSTGFPLLAKALANDSVDAFPSALCKGISLSDWFQYSQKSSPTDWQLAGLRKAGMDHVRLPVDPQYLGWQPDVSASQAAFTKLDELDKAIDTITKAGLIVNLDFHPGQESIQYLKQNQSRIETVLTRALTELIRRYKGLGAHKICFEMMNEPHRFYPDASGWKVLQGKIIKAARLETQEHWLIANGIWDPLSALKTLDVYPDSRVLYSFHFYKPYVVTHQGSKWEPSAAKLFPYLEDVPYPSHAMHASREYIKPGADESYVTGELDKYKDENWDIDRIRREIGVSVSWAKQNKVPIICTEFGIMRTSVDAASRLRWLSDVAAVFKENGIPWTLWDYCNDFGIAQCGAHPTIVEPEAAKALGLFQ